MFRTRSGDPAAQVLSADPVIAARSLSGLLGHLSPDVTFQHYLGTFEYVEPSLAIRRELPNLDSYAQAADLLQVKPGQARSLLQRAKTPLPLSAVLTVQLRRIGGAARRRSSRPQS